VKKQLVAVSVLALLYGCASQPGQEGKPAVEERGTATTPGGAVTTRPVETPVVETNPLKDPNSILSKRSVFYEFDKSDIKEEYRPMLQAHSKYLADHRGTRMLVQGNCDERGSREYNIALGQRRADSVKRLMVLMGAGDSQIESVSLGEEKPRCTSAHDESCWSQNRRSDLLYSGEY
jgi:peptidoglycan-associated lipoprotein